MTADQLINLFFVEHWLFTTIVFPVATFAYAWVTDQTSWALSSFGVFFLYVSFGTWRRS